MIQPLFEVADIINRKIDHLEKITNNTWKLRSLYAIAACRTSRLGYHIDQCDNGECKQLHISYNSCRNRHCPKCQGHKREQWIQNRESELLNAPYYHLVFTLPNEFNLLCLAQPKLVYDTLFKVCWSIVKDFASNPDFLGAKTGMIAILHTWGQNLSLHPHLHCIVPGGGITPSNKWKQAKGKDKYLFPVKAMSKVFRARFVKAVRQQFNLEDELYKQVFRQNWVVYCKTPFFAPLQVIEYLGRYTHKIAISNHRITALDQDSVTFMVKDYRQAGKKRPLTLSDIEFIRRFSLHILPKAYTRIRHYGILGSAIKRFVIPLLQHELGTGLLTRKKEIKHRLCPCCKLGRLVTVAIFKPRGPPFSFSLIPSKLFLKPA